MIFRGLMILGSVVWLFIGVPWVLLAIGFSGGAVLNPLFYLEGLTVGSFLIGYAILAWLVLLWPVLLVWSINRHFSRKRVE